MIKVNSDGKFYIEYAPVNKYICRYSWTMGLLFTWLSYDTKTASEIM